MRNGWSDRITGPNERAIFEALADPAWDFRTVTGVATQTGIAENEVKKVLEKYPDMIRRSVVTDARGDELYTLRSRPITGQERLAQARAIISKSIS